MVCVPIQLAENDISQSLGLNSIDVFALLETKMKPIMGREFVSSLGLSGTPLIMRMKTHPTLAPYGYFGENDHGLLQITAHTSSSYITIWSIQGLLGPLNLILWQEPKEG